VLTGTQAGLDLQTPVLFFFFGCSEYSITPVMAGSNGPGPRGSSRDSPRFRWWKRNDEGFSFGRAGGAASSAIKGPPDQGTVLRPIGVIPADRLIGEGGRRFPHAMGEPLDHTRIHDRPAQGRSGSGGGGGGQGDTDSGPVYVRRNAASSAARGRSLQGALQFMLSADAAIDLESIEKWDGPPRGSSPKRGRGKSGGGAMSGARDGSATDVLLLGLQSCFRAVGYLSFLLAMEGHHRPSPVGSAGVGVRSRTTRSRAG